MRRRTFLASLLAVCVAPLLKVWPQPKACHCRESWTNCELHCGVDIASGHDETVFTVVANDPSKQKIADALEEFANDRVDLWEIYLPHPHGQFHFLGEGGPRCRISAFDHELDSILSPEALAKLRGGLTGRG